MSEQSPEESKKPFIDSANRPDLTIDLDKKVGETTLRELAAILGQRPLPKIPDVKTDLPEKGIKDSKDSKESKDQKEGKDHKDPKEHKDSKDHKDPKEHNDQKLIKDHKDQKEHKDGKDMKDHKETLKEHKDHKEFKEFPDKIDSKALQPDKQSEHGPGDPAGPVEIGTGVEQVIKKTTGMTPEPIGGPVKKK